MDEILKTDHFSYVSALLHADQDHEAKEKQLDMQRFVTLLSFHAILK